MKSLKNLHSLLSALGILDLPAASIKAFLDGHATLLKIDQEQEHFREKMLLEREKLDLEKSKLAIRAEPNRELSMVGNPHRPVIVYQIICQLNNMRYVGHTIHSFNDRYPNGFWVDSENSRLLRDIDTFGLSSFKVRIYECDSVAQAKKMEARYMNNCDQELLYNVKLEIG